MTRLLGTSVLATLLAVAGCCGDPFVPPEPNLSSIQSVVFSRSCVFSSCHGGVTPKAGLDLRAGRSWSTLVGVATRTTASARIRVVPGDPSASYLVDKLSGTGIESNMLFPRTTGMPPMQPLQPETIEAIREWIRRGALDDAGDAGDGGDEGAAIDATESDAGEPIVDSADETDGAG